MDRPARDLESVTPELIRTATDEMLTLVNERLPQRFYSSEPAWRAGLTALVARMAGIIESMRELVDSRRQADALVLLRSLYEHLVTFLWLAIDPEPRVREWYDHTIRHRGKLHNDALAFGVNDILTEDEVREARDAEELKPLQQRANQVDDHWGPKIRGFYSHPDGGPKHILTLGGMYLVIYRLASRQAHATIESVDPWLSQEPNGRWLVTRHPQDTGGLLWSALAIPLFAMALVVSHERLGWPDADCVREINDGLVREDEPAEAG
jgi:hypothetical protein